MAHLDDLKTVLAETLERRGVLSDVRGRIRAEVFNALNDDKTAKPKPSNETIMINELIREYLLFNDYKYAAMTLASESGQADLPLSREFLESELKVKTLEKNRKLPLLYHLVHTYKEQAKQKEDEQINMYTQSQGEQY